MFFAAPGPLEEYWDVMSEENAAGPRGAEPSMQFFRDFAGRSERMRGRLLFRQIRDDERLVKTVATAKILDGIGLRFSEHTFADEIVDHFAEVFATAHTPVMEDGQNHRPVLFQGVQTDSGEQLLSGDMVGAFLGLLALLDRELEGVAKEMISLAVVSRVMLHDEVEFFTEVEFLHRLRGAARKLLTNGCWRRANLGLHSAQLVNMYHTSKLRAEAK